ncbi:hypothetical protein [Pseudomonas huanghezhanensis]|uniref:hypothetical protein n=1 Tax=Pseudomonas huanghezhanensis TaxID=3002903 RepID=UPI002285C4E6|nr:hypothetical protein [Pseudomonas sp. BSw22131]
MKTLISLKELADADLKTFNEIWLSSAASLSEHGPSEDQLCLWRANQLFTHDMLSEGTHGQNVSRVWLVPDDIDAPANVMEIEQAVRARLAELEMEGEFYPAEQADTHNSFA